LGQLREIKVRIVGDDGRAAGHGLVLQSHRNDHAAGRGAGQLRAVLRMGEEGNGISLCMLNRSDAGDGQISRPQQLATQGFNNLTELRHGGHRSGQFDRIVHLPETVLRDLITLSVMSTRGLAKTASWTIRSYLS